MLVVIDGRAVSLSDNQHGHTLKQLDLPPDFVLVDATALLLHDTGNGTVEIPLPVGFVVAAFENRSGQRRYGVVTI
ncbi:hypothetical protein [Pseudomonas simiae]|uniref:Uncharacterized protein n=1 Tax=Pseudomonas simiae TaxID=321846 RepID=U1TPS4_9PSED|nr:hypothetical protein [Pseudomonas simiae]ERH60451.1 hypothetical protein O204_19290 [Pseudomonas simiae]WLG73586.1 hypothetical protein PSH60_26175 [Pseudomonas simiae]WLH17954.1 hypothetical protein PSH75_27035 [Pseudomonas simiae]